MLPPLLFGSSRRRLLLGLLSGTWGAIFLAPPHTPTIVFETREATTTLPAPPEKQEHSPTNPIPLMDQGQNTPYSLPEKTLPPTRAAPAASPKLSAWVEGDDLGGPLGESTPLESEQIGRLLGVAHRELYGVYPGPERWLVGWAHVLHEISRGKTCIENNFGNAVISRRWRGGWHLRRVLEQDRRQGAHWVTRKVRFRSYETPLDGALDYWRIITGHFGSSLPSFDAGDAFNAGLILCERGYSTDSCEAYGAGLRGLYQELRAFYGKPSQQLFSSWETNEPISSLLLEEKTLTSEMKCNSLSM